MGINPFGTVIGQCVVALDFVNSALTGKLPLRFFLLSFCGLSRLVRLREHQTREISPSASCGEAWHCVRQACNSPTTKSHHTGKKKETSRRECPRNWRKKREERVFSPDFTNIIRTTGKSLSVG